MESLERKSNFPPDPPVGVKLGHKRADFDILHYISFIVAFTVLECIKRYWETICEKSK